MRTAVVIPTIAGREHLLTRTLEAYRAVWDVTFFVVRDRPTIGEAWHDGGREAARRGFDFIHLSADDVLPHDGALDVGIGSAAVGVLASPRIVEADGSLVQCGSLGGGMLLGECRTGTAAGSSPFPTLTAEAFMAVSPIPPIHYYADDYIGAAVRTLGWTVSVNRDYAFAHLEGSVGRARVVTRAAADRAEFLRAVAERGLLNIGAADYDAAEEVTP